MMLDVQTSQSDVDQNDATIFTGQAAECEDKSLGRANCCDDSGWAVNADLDRCDAEEKQLGLAREAEKTVYVGDYTDGPWYDESDFEAYCIYPSMLARIIVEQGKAQLGRGFGSPKSPNCSGFTLAEFETLDLNAMDFSEYTSEAGNHISNNTPSDAEIDAFVEQQIQQ